MMRCTQMVLLSLTMLLAAARTAAAAPDVPESNSDDAQQYDQWVEQLGADDFQERESALRRLTGQGLASRAALRRGLKNPDLEIRLRCGQILAAILADDLNHRLSAFIDDVDGKQDHKLPAWDIYSKYAGDDRGARELFVEIFRGERELLMALDAPPQDREAQFLTRLERMQEEMFGRSRPNNTPVPVHTLAALLLIAGQQEGKLSIHAGIRMYSYLTQQQVKQAITEGSRSEQLTRLTSNWVAANANNSTIARYALITAMRYDLKETALEVTRKLVAAKDTSISTLPYAALSIGKFGDRSDLKLLEPHLANKDVCHTWQNGAKAAVKIEVRDVVLATLLHLSEQDHKQYGFDMLQRDAQTLFSIHTCGFVENEDREAAITKWKQWRAG